MQCQPLLAHDTELRVTTPTNMPDDREGEPGQRHDPDSQQTRDHYRAHGRDERYDSREKVSKTFLLIAQLEIRIFLMWRTT
jgi:hypothetical protein